MSTKDHHVIRRSRIEVTMDQHSKNRMLHHTVHKAIQQWIMPILSKLFSQYVPNDVVIHLDKLVIDGGSFNLSTFGKPLPCQVEQMLMLKLKEQIRKIIHNPTLHQVIPLSDAKRQAIAHYLSEGNFAWWMVERSEKQIEKIYLELLHHTPLCIEQLWYNLNKKEKATQRCITLFSRTTLEHTLVCLLKRPIEYFKPILVEIGVLLHQMKILTNLPHTSEEQLLSMALLGVINQQRYQADRMGLLDILLKQVAIQTSTSYEKILEKLHAYYAQDERKSSCDQTTKALVLQLRDLVITPPKFWNQEVKNQEKILKELDEIGNNTMAFYQLSAAMHGIKIAIDQTGIDLLVRSWLQEEKNRKKWVKNLPDTLFVAFLESIDPSIVSIFSDFTQIVTATTALIAPAGAIKAITLAYCAFEHSKAWYFEAIKSLFRKYIAHNIINKQRLAILLTTQTYSPAIKAVMVPLVSISSAILPSADIVNRLKVYMPCSADILFDWLPDRTRQAGYPHLAACFASVEPSNKIDADDHIARDLSVAELLDALQIEDYTTHSDRHPISVSKSTLSDVVDFLIYNELPKNQLVPAYLIAKCLRRATLEQIRDQLTPLCQEAAVLKKLIQHATEVTLFKLFQAFVPFSHQMLNGLERVIMQSKVLGSTEQQTHIRLVKEIFITAAIIGTPPVSEKQYIERILLHLSAQASCRPTILCAQLMDSAKASTDYHLVEVFSLLKENLALLNLNRIDEVDLIFLSTHATFAWDKALLPLYYSRLLPAIKHRVRQSVDLSQSVIDQLVAQHLPTIPKPLQETIRIALYQQIIHTVQSKKERIAERWHLFLHTGQLGNYLDGTALLNDVMAHLLTFSLAQHKTHVRQRLIMHFTHRQLMLLVRRHSEGGKVLANFIEGSYQLWCTIQGSLGHPNSTKNLFWDGVLKTLPQRSIAQDDWLAQITTEWSNVLGITSTTLLETFQLLDSKGLPGGLTSSLNRLQEKYRQRIQQQAMQCGYKDPVLTKFYLLLNGNLSLFAQQYHLAMARLGDELVQYMAEQPFALSKFLEEQDNHQLVARRIAHYFSQEVAIKLIACLAKDNAPFVMHYLNLLSNPLQQTTAQLHHPSTWQKELYISIIYYLITKKPFEEIEFVHSTLLTTCYAKEVVYKIIASIVATEATNQEENKIITLLKPLIKRINEPTIGQPTLANHLLGEVPVTKPKEPSSKVNLPGEEVRVYTKNTGLVFLWPFFYDFFRDHHLMLGKQFFCNQAVHNAVYLLQYLVTGKLKSPEWQLTLPKLLCGLSYDEVLLPYRPIDEDYDVYGQEEMEEMAAELGKQPQQKSTGKIEAGGSISSSVIEGIAAKSQLLIEKVIKRWKGLTNLKEVAVYQDCTTQDILKSYCLNRLGILTRSDANDATSGQFWHLTIMHQDYDRENLLPPWSMTSVKLPWMQEEIILFWMSE